jgi:hypothetical protein
MLGPSSFRPTSQISARPTRGQGVIQSYFDTFSRPTKEQLRIFSTAFGRIADVLRDDANAGNERGETLTKVSPRDLNNQKPTFVGSLSEGEKYRVYRREIAEGTDAS